MTLPPAVSLRPEGAEDSAFLLSLYESAYGAALAMLPVPEAQKQTLVEMQFRAQAAHYRQAYPDASFDIVVRDGEQVGRLCVWRGEGEMRIVDLALMPQVRGLGIGTALIEAVLDEGQRTGCAVRLRVEPWNPARGLYGRLGFVVEEEEMGYVGMVWRPA
ncbi:MAG: GNAT family N-acetyltransferase [Bryobacterales bacterium]|nr:GNAT family N-acetyltransferase [Bryobacterales bacterium]